MKPRSAGSGLADSETLLSRAIQYRDGKRVKRNLRLKVLLNGLPALAAVRQCQLWASYCWPMLEPKRTGVRVFGGFERPPPREYGLHLISLAAQPRTRATGGPLKSGMSMRFFGGLSAEAR
jgi:hypothetical protein